VARQGARELMLLVTDADYPKTPPKARMSPSFHGLDLADEYKAFSDLWERSSAIELPDDWEWNENLYLSDFVIAIEEHLGLRPPAKVNIPVVDEDDEAGTSSPVSEQGKDADEDDDKDEEPDKDTIEEDTQEEAT